MGGVLGGDRFEREAAQELREAGVAHLGARDADVDRFGGALDGNHLGEIIAEARGCQRIPRERLAHLSCSRVWKRAFDWLAIVRFNARA